MSSLALKAQENWILVSLTLASNLRLGGIVASATALFGQYAIYNLFTCNG